MARKHESNGAKLDPAPPATPDFEAILCKIQIQCKKCEDAKILADEAKETAAMLKKEWELEVLCLQKLIRQSEKSPLEEFAEKQQSEEAWREVALKDAFGPLFSEPVLQKLIDAELHTVGQLGDFCQKCQLTEIAGIGQAKAELIEQALESFWKRQKETAERGDAGAGETEEVEEEVEASP